MAVLRELRRQGRQIIVSLFGVVFIGYFAFHAIEGDRGLRAYFALTHKTRLAQLELERLHTQREILEHRVDLLRPDGLDLDMLEERAHEVLGLVHEDEVVVLLNDKAR